MLVGTKGHRLVGMAAMGRQLDFIGFVVFLTL